MEDPPARSERGPQLSFQTSNFYEIQVAY